MVTKQVCYRIDNSVMHLVQHLLVVNTKFCLTLKTTKMLSSITMSCVYMFLVAANRPLFFRFTAINCIFNPYLP